MLIFCFPIYTEATSAILVVSCAVFQIDTANAAPEEKKATAGESVVLPCTISDRFNRDSLPNWWYKRQRSDTLTEIAINGSVVNTLAWRFIISGRPFDGDFSLTIRSPSLADTGIYTCSENEGFGPVHEIHVTVANGSERTLLPESATPSTRPVTDLLDIRMKLPASDSETVPLALVSVVSLLLMLSLLAVVWGAFCHGWRPRMMTTRMPIYATVPLLSDAEPVRSCRYSKRMECDWREAGMTDKCWHDIFIQFLPRENLELTKMGYFYKLLRDPILLHQFIAVFAAYVRHTCPAIDIIVSPDTHGFMFGLLIAHELRKPFVPIRKLRKLPGQTIGVQYTSKCEEGVMYIQKSAIYPGQKVIIIDEKLSTGGTLMAAFELLQKVDANICGCFVVYEDMTYNGREALLHKFNSIRVTSLLTTASELPRDTVKDCSTSLSSQGRGDCIYDFDELP